MVNIFDAMAELVAEEADSIRKHNTDVEATLLEAEKAALDRDYQHEQARQQAVASRAVTLGMAWAASRLLAMAEKPILPEYWIREEDKFEERGVLRKRRIKTGSRHSIVAEGWKLAQWSVERYDKPHTYHTLLLTPHETSLGTNLASFSQPWYEWQRNAEDVRPENVHPISKDPLTNEYMPWLARWPKPKYEGDVPYIPLPTITFKRQDEQNYVIHTDLDGYGRPDYKTYNEAKTDDHIQRAVGRLIAQKLVIDPEQAQKSLVAIAQGTDSVS